MRKSTTSRRSPGRKRIDLSEIPEVSAEAFAKGLVRNGLAPVTRKAQVTLRIDADVIEWFRGKGRGYQTRINSVLKAFKEAHGRS